MKKILSVILIGILTLTLAGCGNEKESSSGQSKENDTTGAEFKHVAAELPDFTFEGDMMEFIQGEQYSEWFETDLENRKAAIEVSPSLQDYYGKSIKQFLDSDDENRVYSPLNLYMALAVLAKTADGETLEQILSLTGAKDMNELEHSASALWLASYQDNPVSRCHLANSLWLSNEIGFNEELINDLATDYYADIFSGEMGSDEMDAALREWTDEHTGGLLSEYTEGMKTDLRTIMELVSTLYYQTSWSDKFDSSQTDDQVFHGTDGDKECSMMHATMQNAYYYCENFDAVARGLADGAAMYFVLPDEGVTFGEVLENEDLIKVVTSRGMEVSDITKYCLIHLSVPKLDVMDKTDLTETLPSLGITDAFDSEKADFSPLSSEADGIFISKADHAVRVMIDEEGVTGAAYTDLAMAGAGMPEDEVDFVLDRPFLFFITENDGAILFAGTVNNIN